MSSSTARIRRPLAAAQVQVLHAPPAVGVLQAPQAEAWAKALFDRLAAALLLCLASPVMLIVALLVKLTSDGPVLFEQQRAGLDGEAFSMLKFRSMTTGAQALEDALDGGSGPFFKVRDDARVTAVGRFLRKSSLDELPQLVNVLRGEMSLVGPRPLLLREHAALPPGVRAWRFSVRPGITGLWQVSGRSNTTDATRLRLDRLYVDNACLAMDLMILARTPAAVLRAEGAV